MNVIKTSKRNVYRIIRSKHGGVELEYYNPTLSVWMPLCHFNSEAKALDLFERDYQQF